MSILTASFKADVVSGSDGAITSGTLNQMTTAIALTFADVGKYIRIEGAGPSTLSGIALNSGFYYSFSSRIIGVSRTGGTTTITMADSADTAGTGLLFRFGTDNGPAISAALGGVRKPTLELPAGDIGVYTRVLLPLGTTVYGRGSQVTRLISLTDSDWVLDGCTPALLPGGAGFTAEGLAPQFEGFSITAKYGIRVGWLDTDTVVDPVTGLTVAITSLQQSYITYLLRLMDIRLYGTYNPHADPNCWLYETTPIGDNELRSLGGCGLQLGCRVVSASILSTLFQGYGQGLRLSGANHVEVAGASRFNANARHVDFNFVPNFFGSPEGDQNSLQNVKMTVFYRTGAIRLVAPQKFQVKHSGLECGEPSASGTSAAQHLIVEGGGWDFELISNKITVPISDPAPCPTLSLDLGPYFKNRIQNNYIGGAHNAHFEIKNNYSFGTTPCILWAGNWGDHTPPDHPGVQLSYDANPLLLRRDNYPSTFQGPYNSTVSIATNTYNPSSAWPWVYDSTYNLWTITSGGTDPGVVNAAFLIPNPGMRHWTVQVTGLARSAVTPTDGNGFIAVDFTDSTGATTRVLATLLGFGLVPGAVDVLETVQFSFDIPPTSANAGSYFNVFVENRGAHAFDIVSVELVPAALSVAQGPASTIQTPGTLQVVDDGSGHVVLDVSAATVFLWSGSTPGAYEFQVTNIKPGQSFILKWSLTAAVTVTFSVSGPYMQPPAYVDLTIGSESAFFYFYDGFQVLACGQAPPPPAPAKGVLTTPSAFPVRILTLTPASGGWPGGVPITAASAYSQSQFQTVCNLLNLILAGPQLSANADGQVTSLA